MALHLDKVNQLDTFKSKRGFDIAYNPRRKYFKRNLVQLQIEDIRPIEDDSTEEQ